MKRLFLLISAALITGAYVQAADAKAAKADAKPAGTVQNYDSKEAKVGDTVICPVMKESFKVTDRTKAVTVKGKKYYICCAQCEAELKKNPDKYLAAAKADAKKTGAQSAPAKNEHPK